MYHIVIFSSIYYQQSDANGRCAKALADELLRRGCSVDVVCSGDEQRLNVVEDDRYFVHTIFNHELNIFSKREKIKHNILAVWNLKNYPVRSEYRVRKYIELFEIINSREKVDAIIAVQKPVETTEAAYQIKKKYPNVAVILYELDSLSNDAEAATSWKRFFQKCSDRRELVYFDGFDKLLHISTYVDYYHAPLFQKYKNKTEFVDIPLVSRESYEAVHDRTPDTKDAGITKFLYSGVLMQKYRSPAYLISLTEAIKEKLPLHLIFYSRGDCGEMLADAVERNIGIISQNDYVPQETLNEEISESDFLISIGNKSPETMLAIPSKIFAYMTTGKPVIHFISGEHDVCIPFLINYPLICLIDPSESMELNQKKLIDFINANKGKRVPFSEISKILSANTAEPAVNAVFESIMQLSNSNK